MLKVHALVSFQVPVADNLLNFDKALLEHVSFLQVSIKIFAICSPINTFGVSS